MSACIECALRDGVKIDRACSPDPSRSETILDLSGHSFQAGQTFLAEQLGLHAMATFFGGSIDPQDQLNFSKNKYFGR